MGLSKQMKKHILNTLTIILLVSAVAFAITIPDPTTFLDKIIVERRVGEPSSSQTNRGRIFFDEVDQKFKGDNGLLILEFGSDIASAHTMLSATHSDTVPGSVVRGDILVSNATPKLAKFAIGTANQLLTVNTAGTTLEYKTFAGTASEIDVAFGAGTLTISLPATYDLPLSVTNGGTGTTALTGILIGNGASAFTADAVPLSIANGGTNTTTLTDGGILLGSGATTAITAMAVFSDGGFLVGDGTGDPVEESGQTARTSMGAGEIGANYLVGTATTGLTAEIVVGLTPSLQLGGTWGAITVDASHSGSAHHTQSHTVVSHSDTTATGAETETLTDGSNADALHTHTHGDSLDVKLARKTADEVVTSNPTCQNDDHISFAIGANEVWLVYVHFTSNIHATPDMKVCWSTPAGSTGQHGAIAAGSGSTTYRTTLSTGVNIAGSSANQGFTHWALIDTAGTSGTAQWQWAQITTDANAVTVRNGSFMIAWRLS